MTYRPGTPATRTHVWFRVALICAAVLAVLTTAAVVITRLAIHQAEGPATSQPQPAINDAMHSQTLTVPDLTGMSQRDAVAAIRRAHLDLGAVAELPYPAAAGGTVIAQDPAAATQQASGSRVGLLLASGNASAPSPATAGAIVPQLVGMSLHQAAQAILSAGFTLGRMTDVSAPGPNAQPGIVIVQVPRASTHLATGSRIDLTVQR